MSVWNSNSHFTMSPELEAGTASSASGMTIGFTPPVKIDAVFTGDAGNNTINGTSSDDFFNMNDGGNDTVNGLAGNDIFTFAGTLTSADKVNGGTGYDVVLLNGNYTAGVTFSSTTLLGVEEIDVSNGNNYKLTTNDATVASGQTLVIGASGLDSSHTLNFDGSAETNGLFNITSGAGNDTIKFGGNAEIANSGAGNDTFNISGSNAGHDTLNAGAGDDVMNFGALFNSTDQLSGGTGNDTLNLNGDYTSFVGFSATTLVSFERINFAAGHNYALSLADSTTDAGVTLFVDASLLAAGQTAHIFDGNDANGALHFEGGAGDDQVNGTNNNDLINGNSGNDILNPGLGTDTVHGGIGDDSINMAGGLDATDTLDGGTGNNTLTVNGDYSAGVTLGATTIQNFKFLTFFGDFSYKFTTNDANVAAGTTLNLLDSFLTASDTITFDGSAETDGSFSVTFSLLETTNLKFGAGNDVVAIAHQITTADRFDGGAGFDHLQLTGGNAGTIVLDATQLINWESIGLYGAANYSLKFNDATVAAGQTVTVSDNTQLASNTFIVDASAETDGFLHFNIDGLEAKDVTGGSLSDQFSLGANLHPTDHIDGGAGTDYLYLDGDYAAGITFGATTVLNFEVLQLAGNHSYVIVTNDATVAAGQTFSVQAGGLTDKDVLDFNGAAETDGNFSIYGGSGDDALTGGAGNDVFGPGIGNDTVHGGGGDDQIYLGNVAGEFTPLDTLDGGSGYDVVYLQDDLSAGIVFGANTISNIETLDLSGIHAFDITTNDGNVVAGQTLNIYAGTLAPGNALTFNGSAETDGNFSIIGSANNDSLTTGGGDDTILAGTGKDVIHAGAGADTILFTSGFDSSDTVDGGNGNKDVLELQGDYSAGVVFNAATMTNVETIRVDTNRSYTLTTNDGNVASGDILTVDATALNSSYVLTFDGSAETDGAFNIKGGAGADILTGGAGNDQIDAGSGDNTIVGGAGNDVITTGFGSDIIDGGDGDDTIDTGSGFDTAHGGNGDDSITLGASNASSAYGEAGSDYLEGNATGDTLSGGDGNDLVVVGGNGMIVDGGDGNDEVTVSFGSNEIIAGGNGDDTFDMLSNLVVTDTIDGGAGNDTLYILGSYSALTLAPTTIANIENITLGAGINHGITSSDGTVAAGQVLTVDASAVAAGNIATFNGAAEHDGTFVFIGGGAVDNFTGSNGADQFQMGALFQGIDTLTGGGGSDTLFLDGDYTTGLVLGASTLSSIETIGVAAGSSYKITANDGNVASGKTLSVDASLLGAADKLTFDGSAELNGHFTFSGGAGGDALTGGALSDTFDFTLGGNDIGVGGAGDDTFNFAAALTSADKIDGGAGNDTAVLNGDYSTQFNFGSTTMLNVETLSLKDGFNYNLHPSNATVAAGQTLTVDGSHLGVASMLTFKGNAESDGNFAVTGGNGADSITGGAGNDTLNGGGGDDTIDLTVGGNDTVIGGGGADIFHFGATFTAADSVDGGGNAQDTLHLNGNYAAGVTFLSTTVQNVGIIKVDGGHSYTLTSVDATVGAGKTMTVDASTLTTSDHLVFNGAAESNGTLVINGGAGSDTLTGGAGADQLKGGLGGDMLTGGGGADLFITRTAAESTGVGYDTLNSFDFAVDQIDVAKKIKAIDATIVTGSLSLGSMDSDLASAANAAHLGVQHAVLFNVTAGGLSGHTFLVVDANGVAGYQAGADYAFDVTGAAHMASIATTDFV